MSNGLRIEDDIKALFFDSSALREPAYKLRRVNTKLGRFYYTHDDSMADPKIYMGMTSILSAVVPRPQQLIDWMVSMGPSYKEYVAVKASFGTLLHLQIANFCLNGNKYNFDEVESIVKDYVRSEPKEIIESKYFNLSEWIENIKSDVLAWSVFVKDYKVSPIAIEIPLIHPSGFSGTIDIPARMTIDVEGDFGEKYKSGPRKGEVKLTKQPKEIIAIIDIKSTRKGSAHLDYRIQLAGYRRLMEANFPEIKIEKLYNWSPKEWRDQPSYTLSEKADISDELFDSYIMLGKMAMMDKTPEYQEIVGSIDGDSDAMSCIRNISLIEHIKKQSGKKEEKKVANLSQIEYLQGVVQQLQEEFEVLKQKLNESTTA